MAKNKTDNTEVLRSSILRFVEWLERYGETSYDHQSYFASDLGRRAKALYYRKPLLGTLAVSPMIFSEAFVPSARRLFWKPQRFPIADAHYAMGFAFLSEALQREPYYNVATHFLQVLKETRTKGFQHYAWGYPFNWETRNGTILAWTPYITTLPYAYEAFRDVYRIDGNPEWLEILRSIAMHGFEDYRDFETSGRASTCCYSPGPENSSGVVNASAYRAFLLTAAALDFSEDKYKRVADRNLNFVLESQNDNGSWFYSMDNKRDFVDHFHTCFVLKALAKIEQLTGNQDCTNAIERGVKYYTANLFDEHGLPKPFSKPPRLTVYKHELYDYAECINVATLLHGRFQDLDKVLSLVLDDVFTRWQKTDGSFRARKLLVGWDNVPMHRWAQSQLFRSLAQLLKQRIAKRSGQSSPDVLRLQPLQTSLTA
jgi:hypothetical protein